MSVLIVEDDPALGRLLRTLMVRERLGVEVEARGESALAAIESGRHRAIVLDLRLPGMSGFEIVRHLARVRPELLRRIIVLTAVSQSQLEHFELRTAVWTLIRKPFDVPEFVRAIRECIAAQTPSRFDEIEELTRWLAAAAKVCGARTALIATSSGHELMLAAAFGYADGLVDEYFPLSISGNYPLCVTVRTGRPVWLASLMPPLPDYPLLLPIWTTDGHALATVPLLCGESRLGAIGWTFSEPQRFDEAQQTTLVTMASECAAMVAEQRSLRRAQ
jgi:CheY-like chemotaxis protein